MNDGDLKQKIKEVLTESRLWTGEREVWVDEMALFQPKLGSVMLEVSQRAWPLYYAAKARNWKLAKNHWEKIEELIEGGSFLRPKYGAEMKNFLAEDWPAIGKAIENQDLKGFEKAFHKAIHQANVYHELTHRPWLKWKLPDAPPPDLDLTAWNKR